jgi:hypothetical protein
MQAHHLRFFGAKTSHFNTLHSLRLTMQALTDAIAERRVLDAIAVQLKCPWTMSWRGGPVWRCFMYGLRLVFRRVHRFNYAIDWDAITAALRKANTAVTETWLQHRHAMGLTGDPQLYHICGFTGLTADEVREHWAPCICMLFIIVA